MPMIRAHDLGPRNQEIFDYYAETQPERMFYRFDAQLVKEGKDPLVRLGSAASLGTRGGERGAVQ
jgi:hypothetical protein